MSPDSRLLDSGADRRFELAGLSIRYRNDLAGGVSLGLPETYSRFESGSASGAPSLDISVSSAERLEPSEGEPLRTAVHWTLHGTSKAAVFDFRHVPTSRVYCRARLEPEAGTAEILFAEATWREGGGARRDPEGRELPFPLEQLLLLPVLALNGAVLLHAGGGLYGDTDQAFVYAGHSGDGKTTLSGLLTGEGVTLLSDERIVVRERSGSFVACGTPWSGTGNVASPLGAPLSMALLLKKSERHALSEPSVALVPELVSRAIVPYYFRDLAGEMLQTFAELSRAVPVRELEFARAPGVMDLLRSDRPDRRRGPRGRSLDGASSSSVPGIERDRDRALSSLSLTSSIARS